MKTFIPSALLRCLIVYSLVACATVFAKTPLRDEEIPNGFAVLFMADLAGNQYVASGVALREGVLITAAHNFTPFGAGILPTRIWIKTHNGFRLHIANMNTMIRHPYFVADNKPKSELEIFSPKYISDQWFSDIEFVKIPDWAYEDSAFELGTSEMIVPSSERPTRDEFHIISIDNRLDLIPAHPIIKAGEISLEGEYSGTKESFRILKTKEGPIPGDSGGPIYIKEGKTLKVVGLNHRASSHNAYYVSTVGMNREIIKNSVSVLNKKMPLAGLTNLCTFLLSGLRPSS